MTVKITDLKPEQIQIGSNIRHKILPFRLERLTSEIETDGKVHVPIIVEKLETPNDEGHTHRLIAGEYRTRAVLSLNAKGAGMTIPAIVEEFADDKERLLRQLSENMERENLSPIDEAISIKQLMDLGFPTIEIRKRFSRPGGKGKALKMEPASNSFINMRLSFLNFPAKIQNAIADGRLGVKAAYELTKKSPDKWQEIVDAAEKARIKEYDDEQASEAKLLADEKKRKEQEEKDAKAKQEAEVIATEAAAAAKLVEQRQKEEKAAFDLKQAAKTKEERAKATEALNAAKKNAEAALKISEDKAAKAAAAQKKLNDRAAKLAEAKARLAAARAARAGGTSPAVPPISDADINNAANNIPGANPDGPKLVPLNATDMKKVVADLCLPSGYANVQKIGEAFRDCFNSVTTPGQLTTILAQITGEYKAPAKPRTRAAG
jgi:ParB/RepB/Spo0J family partition protein